MAIRRVLTCDRQSRAAPSFVITEEGVPAQGSEQILVQVARTIVDPEPLLARSGPDVPEAAFVGTVLDGAGHAHLSRGEVVVGVGPITDVALLAPERAQPVRRAGGLGQESMALLPYVSSLIRALGDAHIGPQDKVLVSGGGLVSRVAEQLVEMCTGRPPHTLSRPGGAADGAVVGQGDEAKDFDVLIDTTVDSDWWPKVLPLVREQGRVLLVLPPAPLVLQFDFYPDIHRRSLSLLARMVPSTGGLCFFDDAGEMLQHLLTRGLVALTGLLSEVRVGSQLPDGVALHPEGVPRGKGLAICWSGEGT